MLTLSKLKFSCLFLIWLPVFALAMPIEQCKSYPFLKKGFDLQAYEQCSKQLQQCFGNMPNQVCVNKVVAGNMACHQLQKLAHKLNASPDVITAQAAENKFIIIKHLYRADDEEDYSIISPQACLVTPKIYPRNYNTIFRSHRKIMDFYPRITGVPKYKLRAGGVQSFVIPLEVRNICAACEVLGKAQASMDFTENGKFIQTTLEP